MNSRFPRKQQGAVTVIAAMLLVSVVLVIGLSTTRMAATDINDSSLQRDAIEALFLAETGLEYATALFASNGLCDSSLSTSAIAFGNGDFTVNDIGANFTTGFDGVALPSTQCRVRVTATSGVQNASRTLEAIIENDPNLLSANNPDFNLPAGPCSAPSCYPTGWTLDDGGWQDGTAPDWDRAAKVTKPTNGPSEVTVAGSFALTPFTLTSATTLTLEFDYSVSAGNPTNEFWFEVTLIDSNGNSYLSSPDPFRSGRTTGFVNGSVTFSLPGGAPITITQISFNMVAKSGQAKTILLDNLNLIGPVGTGNAEIILWREIIA